MNRVYMIPEKDFHRQRQLSLPNTTNSPVNALQKSLQDLNAQPQLTDAARWKEYEQLFNTYNAFSKKPYMTNYGSRQKDEETKQLDEGVLQSLFAGEEKDVISHVIAPIFYSLPQRLREKGLHLLEFIAQTQDVLSGAYQISRMGQLRIHGEEVVGTNILDLIHYAVRPIRKTVSPPMGWTVFFDFLKQNNVPSELLAVHHHTRVKLPMQRKEKKPLVAKRHSQSILTDDEDEKFDSPSAPSPQKKSSILKPAKLNFIPTYDPPPPSPPRLRRFDRRRIAAPYEKPLKPKQAGKGVWSVYH